MDIMILQRSAKVAKIEQLVRQSLVQTDKMTGRQDRADVHFIRPKRWVKIDIRIHVVSYLMTAFMQNLILSIKPEVNIYYIFVFLHFW